MCGGSKTQTASSGQGGIPPELQPLIGGSVDQTLGIQASNPLSSYVGPNPQQIQGLSGSEGDFLQGIMGLSQMGYTGPESGAWRALEGVQQNPLGFGAASSPEGTYTMPEMGALQELISGLNAPIGSSPVTLQAMKAWQQNVAPQVRNQQALQGTLYGGAADEAIANSASSAMVPLIQQEMQSRAAAIPQLMQLGGTAANRFRGDTQQEISNLMSTVGPLMELGGTGANRYRSDLQQGLTAASVPRDIANQQNQAEFQDYMRRYGMSQQATLGPLMEVLPNLLSQVQTSTTKGSGGGMFGSALSSRAYLQGRMPVDMYLADCEFGNRLPIEVLRGYWRFGVPLARTMKRSRFVSAMVIPFVLAWGREMQKQITGIGEGSRFGRMAIRFGIPLCAFLGRRENSFAQAPIFSQPITDSRTIDTGAFDPFAKAKRLAIQSDQAISSFVPCLLFRSSPSAIVRSVWSVYVRPAINTFSSWSRPHIRQKILKGTPSFTDRYSASAVIWIIRALRVLATIFDAAPAYVGRCLFFYPRMAMSEVIGLSCSQAPAAFTFAHAQTEAHDCVQDSSASAAAVPSSNVVTTPLVGGAPDNSQSPKRLTRDIFEGRHFDLLFRSLLRALSDLRNRFGLVYYKAQNVKGKVADPPSRAKFRRGIINLQDFMVQKIQQGVIEPGHLPLRHHFTPIDKKYGCCAYAREILLPKGQLSIGKIHKHSHLNFILKGKVSVETEFGRKYYEAPCIFVSEPGLKRAVLAIEDTIWATVHLTEHRGEGNLDKIESEVIAKTYEELDDLGFRHSSSRSGR